MPANVEVGNVIWYKLLPRDLPTERGKRAWKGKILGKMGAMLRVELLDDGYQGMTEAIWTEQVLAVSK